jgi:hypothetical protein
MRQIQLALACALFASCVFAKAGPRIPKPTVEAPKAIALAKAVQVKGAGLAGVAVARPIEYILIRVEYVPSEAWPDDPDNWTWEVEFAHPIQNSHRAVYMVDRKGLVSLKSVSE